MTMISWWPHHQSAKHKSSGISLSILCHSILILKIFMQNNFKIQMQRAINYEFYRIVLVLLPIILCTSESTNFAKLSNGEENLFFEHLFMFVHFHFHFLHKLELKQKNIHKMKSTHCNVCSSSRIHLFVQLPCTYERWNDIHVVFMWNQPRLPSWLYIIAILMGYTIRY